jgi:hypothetical protein
VDVNAPLSEFGLLSPNLALVAAVALGLAFGFFLEQGGLGNARKLAGQFYGTDFTVLKVMFSAIVTAALGLFWLAWAGFLDLSRVYVLPTYVMPQLVGGLVFGVGFVMGGLCPGTSCVAASSGRLDGVVLLVGMLFGIVVFNELYQLLATFYESTPMGQVTLPRLIGVPHGLGVFAIALMAVGAFVVASRFEQRRRAQ